MTELLTACSEGLLAPLESVIGVVEGGRYT
jgi:hypothetical protein